MSKQFAANRLDLNLDKTNIILFIANNSPQHAFNTGCNGKYIEQSVNVLGLRIDNHLNWTNNIDKFIPKLIELVMELDLCVLSTTFDTLKSIYFAYLHPTMKYGIFMGSNSPNSKEIFTLKNKIFRLIAGTKLRGAGVAQSV
jgi:hypothetical protein